MYNPKKDSKTATIRGLLGFFPPPPEACVGRLEVTLMQQKVYCIFFSYLTVVCCRTTSSGIQNDVSIK